MPLAGSLVGTDTCAGPSRSAEAFGSLGTGELLLRLHPSQVTADFDAAA